MKRLFTFLITIALTVFFFSCTDNNPNAPDLNQDNQSISPLEKKAYSYFSGTSVTTAVVDPGKTVALPDGRQLIRGLVVVTHDVSDDPLVTGDITWVVNLDVYPDGSDKRWGSGELIITDVGRWDLTYKGWFVPGEGLTYEVDGHGKGDLKGLKVHLTYFLESPPGIFDVTGFIFRSGS